MRNPPQRMKSFIHQHRLALLILTLLFATLACSLPRTLFETFVSPGDLDDRAVATWEEEYADEYDLEVIEEDEPAGAPDSGASPAQTGQLTPQEEKNQGTHQYRISGTSTPMLGNDGTIEDAGLCSSDFTSDGVNFKLLDYNAGFFSRISENKYEQVTEAGTRTTLEYTDTGILYYSLTESGNFQDMELTLDD